MPNFNDVKQVEEAILAVLSDVTPIELVDKIEYKFSDGKIIKPRPVGGLIGLLSKFDKHKLGNPKHSLRNEDLISLKDAVKKYEPDYFELLHMDGGGSDFFAVNLFYQ